MSEFEKAFTDSGLSMRFEFVPWSRSRSAKRNPKLSDFNLNWKIVIMRGDRVVLETDYMQGQGFCPSYSQRKSSRPSVDYATALRHECETGRGLQMRPVTPPCARDVMDALLMDADAIDYATYEEWASELGYDPDSRKGEATYRACLETALKLRAAIGEDGMRALREALRADEDANVR